MSIYFENILYETTINVIMTPRHQSIFGVDGD